MNNFLRIFMDNKNTTRRCYGLKPRVCEEILRLVDKEELENNIALLLDDERYYFTQNDIRYIETLIAYYMYAMQRDKRVEGKIDLVLINSVYFIRELLSSGTVTLICLESRWGHNMDELWCEIRRSSQVFNDRLLYNKYHDRRVVFESGIPSIHTSTITYKGHKITVDWSNNKTLTECITYIHAEAGYACIINGILVYNKKITGFGSRMRLSEIIKIACWYIDKD
jgi:hypothetical protein